MLDLVIIGASAAGASAGIYAARKNLNFKIIAKETGGEIATSGEVANFPGWGKILGKDISEKFQEHLRMYNVYPETGLLAKKIKINDNNFEITAQEEKKEKKYQAKSVIIATGMKPRRLSIDGEKKFRNKGVTYCSVCDAPLFKGKTVAVIGGGNSALESAIMLKDIAKKVYLLNIHSKFKGDEILIEKIKESEKIKTIYNATTTKIIGDNFVNTIQYKNKKTEKQEIKVQGVFVHIGMKPNTNFIPKKLETNDYGEIITNKICQTNIKGIFAAGDVTNIPYKQIAIASGQGVTAALSSINYLNKIK